MLSSIHPLGERARGNHFWRTAVAHVIGATVAGAVAGALVGGLGHVLTSVLSNRSALWIIALVAAAGLAVDVLRRPVSLWPHRQVDDRWIGRYRGWVYGAGFGAQLGVGVTTIVVAATVYVLYASFFLVGSPLFGAVVGGLFGAVRGSAIFLSARASTPSALVALHRRLDHLRARTALLAAAGDGALVAGALVAAWRGAP
jgi:hypothetical protein